MFVRGGVDSMLETKAVLREQRPFFKISILKQTYALNWYSRNAFPKERPSPSTFWILWKSKFIRKGETLKEGSSQKHFFFFLRSISLGSAHKGQRISQATAQAGSKPWQPHPQGTRFPKCTECKTEGLGDLLHGQRAACAWQYKAGSVLLRGVLERPLLKAVKVKAKTPLDLGIEETPSKGSVHWWKQQIGAGPRERLGGRSGDRQPSWRSKDAKAL